MSALGVAGMSVMLIEPQCGSCRHLVPGIASSNGKPSCAAFPDGVPRVILAGIHDHRQPYPSDRGIRWESNGQPYPSE